MYISNKNLDMKKFVDLLKVDSSKNYIILNPPKEPQKIIDALVKRFNDKK